MSLDASSNEERNNGDRDNFYSELMRYPGTEALTVLEKLGLPSADDYKKRRPGFEYIRSFDTDVSPLCDLCSRKLAIFEAQRGNLKPKPTRYVEVEAEVWGVRAYLLEVCATRDVLETGWVNVKKMCTGEPRLFSILEFVKWVEGIYIGHKSNCSGILSADGSSIPESS